MAGTTINNNKRKTPGLDSVPEYQAAKRTARAGYRATTTPMMPSRSAAPPATASKSASGLSFHSEGHNKVPATGPAPGEETFEDLQARTGASEGDILGKKMAFKKGMQPAKKLEEMAPMIKELRFVWGVEGGLRALHARTHAGRARDDSRACIVMLACSAKIGRIRCEHSKRA